MVKGGSEITEWEEKRCFEMFLLGEEKQKNGQLISTSVSKETKSTLRRTETEGWMGEGMCVGEGGLQPPHPKKTKSPKKKKKKSSRVEGLLYIHIYEYIDNTADKGVCKSIYFHYIDSYDGRKDFLVCRLSRKGDLLVLVTNTSGALLRADPSKTWRQTEASLPQLFRSTEMDKLNTHTSEGSM